jgi:iron complex outermembrane receptor protein/hemoglobin/transferrin/lactoferrin receptor protein
VEARATDEVSVLLNVDQGFRAPNLDDLTSRQQIGPGFQIENAALAPERSLTTELGLAIDADVLRVDAWAFATLLEQGMIRAVREASDCPAETPECATSRNQLMLVNAEGDAWIFGAEGGVTAFLPEDVTVRATVSYAWGEGPNTGARPSDPAFLEARVPLSRVPPLNGTVEARYRHIETGFFGGVAMRWALAQPRLAPADRFDARIPIGGTPGYAVLDLRAGIRFRQNVRVSLVFENVFDQAWRAHGSSINGPGRGLLAEAMVGW